MGIILINYNRGKSMLEDSALDNHSWRGYLAQKVVTVVEDCAEMHCFSLRAVVTKKSEF